MASINAKASIYGTLDPNTYINNVGFNSQSNPFLYGSKCTGKGTAMNGFKSIPCHALELDPYDIEGCNDIEGCEWNNASLFITVGCYEFVNTTFYNITGSFNYKASYCGASGLQNLELCETFGCHWYNNTNEFTQQRDVNSKYSTATIWETISWVALFNIDIGWNQFNWIISILFYILMLALLMALYYMFIPF